MLVKVSVGSAQFMMLVNMYGRATKNITNLNNKLNSAGPQEYVLTFYSHYIDVEVVQVDL